jgi:hypothetical protein
MTRKDKIMTPYNRHIGRGGWLLVAACAALACATAYGVTEGAGATGLSQSDPQGKVTFSGVGGGSITVEFGSQGEYNDLCSTMILVDSSVPGSVFVGDYSAVGQVSFTVVGDGHRPKDLVLTLGMAGNLLKWRYVIGGGAVSATAGQVATVVVPMGGPAAGWKTDSSGDKAAMWKADIRNVAQVGIRISRGGAEAQSYTVANFMLDGKLGGAEFIPQRVLSYFGEGVTQLTAEMKALDTDKDGVPDYLEVWAGTNPNDENSIFAAKIVSVSGNTAKIEWPYKVAGSTYTVLRSDRVGGPFSVLDANVGVDNPYATVQDETLTYADGTAKQGVAYFYKIVLE